MNLSLGGVAVTLLLAGAACAQQQPIGSVATQDASVAGTLEVTGGRALLVGSSSVTARDRTAEVTLQRGGTVRICQTSLVKLSSGASASPAAATPLMLALDRGAIEVKMPAAQGDTILTPDLRFAVRSAGPLDPSPPGHKQWRHVRRTARGIRANARSLRPLRGGDLRGARGAAHPFRARQPARSRRP